MPKRIQRTRIRDWRMPDDAIYVGRTGGKLSWGNPARVGMHFMVCDDPNDIAKGIYYRTSPEPANGYTYVDSAATAVAIYRDLFEKGHWFSKGAARMLGGHDLVCWCRLDQPCHADVLLELANPATPGQGS